jgi:hypothetical protein
MKNLVLIILILPISCIGQNSKHKKKANAFYQHQKDYTATNILIDSLKIRAFNTKMKTLWIFYPITLVIDGPKLNTEPKNIGLYSYFPLSAHFLYVRYFLNYQDSVVFIDRRDTVNWNKKINTFLQTYQNILLQSDRDSIQSQLIK